MRRILAVLLIVVLFAGLAKVIADEAASNASRDRSNTKAGETAAASPDCGGENDRRSLALPETQLVLWQEDPQPLQPVKPDVPATLPSKPAFPDDKSAPAAQTPPIAGKPDLLVPDVHASPAPAIGPVPDAPASLALPAPALQNIPAAPASPLTAGPSGPVALPPVAPGQVAGPPAAAEGAAAAKENGPPLPFDVMDSNRETEMTVKRGRSQLLRSTVEFTRTAVVDPNICDLIQYSPTELGLIGKRLGTTQVTLWFRESDNPNVDTQPRSIVVRVVPDLKEWEPRLKQLEAEIAKLFPNSKVRLRTFGQRIMVLGQARDVSEAAEILNIIRGEEIDAGGRWVSGPNLGNRTAQGGNDTSRSGLGGGDSYGGDPYGGDSYGGDSYGDANAGPFRSGWGVDSSNAGGSGGRGYGNRGRYGNQGDWASRIVNMLKVPGVHQVMLRVKIAELNRTAARNFGVNFSSSIQFRNGTLLLQSLLNASNSNSVIGNFSNDQLSFGISYLEQHGVIRLLSEPTLVTMSGKAANFVAGGEFAVPTVVGISGASAVSTQFVTYGAIISFTPYLLDKDLIRLHVSPEFSQIDAATTVNGVPGLTTRTVTTTVELRAGQTLAIAGLLSDSMNSNTQADWPWIGKILGPRSVSRSETELIVLVTPELVHPMEPEEVPPMPGFDVTEPSNEDFFLRGDIEGNPTRDYRSTVWPILQQRYRAGGSPMISGPFGHSNPWANGASDGPSEAPPQQ